MKTGIDKFMENNPAEPAKFSMANYFSEVKRGMKMVLDRKIALIIFSIVIGTTVANHYKTKTSNDNIPRVEQSLMTK